MEQHLDARGLEPPMPMIRILDTLEILPQMDSLQVTLSREPYPLYALLRQMDFVWETHRSGPDVVVRIWHAKRRQ
ncbi:MAG: DUF2249 domain-containing protein [Candidatus Thiodiazotropha sp.]